MRKLFALTFFIIGAFLVGQNSALAQNAKSDVLYNTPSRLMLKDDDKEAEEAKSGALLREKFYPIGWSKDGKFAYYVEPPDEACGCYFAKLVIQDLRNDKVLWVYDNAKVAFENEQPEETIAEHWKKHQALFSRKLAQYAIVPQKSFTLLTSPFEFKNDSLTPVIKINLEVTNEDSVKGNIILRLMSKNKGSKTIYEKNYKKTYEGIRNAEVSGILMSPFEARATIIMVETYRGYEGPPNITNIKIVGATLNGGFK
ncbi:MAG: hypothetical protein ABI891_09305 [Acidobacteriota bacterium]